MSLYKTPEGEQAVMAAYDAALQSWPVAYETQMIPMRHGDTFVIASGNPASPALILLHGAGSNSTMWAGDVGAYSHNFRVYAVDLIGEAGKSAVNRPAWEGAAFAEWLEDVLNGLKVERAAFVGISQGAWAALKLAVAMPERVAKLALIAPAGVVPDKSTFLLRAIGGQLLGNWGTKRFVRSLFGDQSIPDSIIHRITLTNSQFKPRIGTLPIFTDDELRQLTMPVLLLGGTKDIARDIEAIAARFDEFLPQLTVKIAPGGGHALLHTVDDVMGFLAG